MKKNLLLFLLFSIWHIGNGQELKTYHVFEKHKETKYTYYEQGNGKFCIHGKYYRRDSTKELQGEYCHGLRIGLWKYSDHKGEATTTYKKGMQHGEFHYKSDSIEIYGKNIYGFQNGVWTQKWLNDSTQIYSEYFRQGNLIHKIYKHTKTGEIRIDSSSPGNAINPTLFWKSIKYFNMDISEYYTQIGDCYYSLSSTNQRVSELHEYTSLFEETRYHFITETIFAVSNEMPKFPHGEVQKWILQKLSATHQLEKIQGYLYVSFLIEKDGSVSNANIQYNRTNSIIANKVIELIQSMPKWTPGKANGRSNMIPVKVRMVEKISFNKTE